MDIRGAFARGLCQQRIDHADDRRVVLGFKQVLHRRDVLHQARQVDFAFDLAHHLRGAAGVLAVVGIGHGALQRVGLQHAQAQRAMHARDLGQRGRRGGAGHPDFQSVRALVRDQQRRLARKAVRDQPRGHRRGRLQGLGRRVGAGGQGSLDFASHVGA
ncbi:hypothetical protein D3C72_1673310 [compost metagenome]